MSTAVALADEQHPAPSQKPANIVAGSPVRAIVPQDFEGAYRIANAVCRAGMAPRGLESTEKAMVAIMHGLEVGLTPMNALQSIAVVNGRPTVWGDGAVGLVRGSGLLEWMEETISGENDAMTAICTVKRRGEPKPIIGRFSVADAKKAGLWGKAGPWTQYPKRMLQMRARSFTLRDGFADVLKGLQIREEVEDYHNDPAPREEPPAPPPVAQIEHHEVAEATIQPAPEPVKEPAKPAPADDGLDIPESLRRTKPAAAAEQPAPAPDTKIPDGSNPELFLKWVERICAEAQTGEALEATFNDLVAPRLDVLFPPDQEEAMGIYRKRERDFQ